MEISCKNIRNFGSTELEIGRAQLEACKTVKLLGITKDDKLNFEKHLFELSKKGSMSFNAIIHLEEYIGKEQEESTIKSFIFSNFDYYPFI